MRLKSEPDLGCARCAESGKRRPHCLFRKRKWRKLGRRVRRSLSNAFMGGAAAARSRGRSKSTESKVRHQAGRGCWGAATGRLKLWCGICMLVWQWASEDGDQQPPEGLASMAAPSISYAEDEDERRKEERYQSKSPSPSAPGTSHVGGMQLLTD